MAILLADQPRIGALQLRAMNIIYEMTKERGATILIPTMMVDSMNAGGIMSLAAMANKDITGTAQQGPWAKPEGPK